MALSMTQLFSKFLQRKWNRFQVIWIVLNFAYMISGGIVIGLSISSFNVALSTQTPLSTGLAVVGTGLVILAVFGLSTVYFEQRRLFYVYLGFLIAICLVHLGLAGDSLASSQSNLMQQLARGWLQADNKMRSSIQLNFHCCGFEDPNLTIMDPGGLGHPPCAPLSCCRKNMHNACCAGRDIQRGAVELCPCQQCWSHLLEHMKRAKRIRGVVALFSSMIQLFGIVLLTVHLLQKSQQHQEEIRTESEDLQEVPYERF